MMTFGKDLGELAGHDIVLWREAGLDPLAGLSDAKSDRFDGVVARAAMWAKRMCRRSANEIPDQASVTYLPHLRARPLHVHSRSRPVEKA